MNIYCKVCGKELGYTFLGQICFGCYRKLTHQYDDKRKEQ